MKKQMKKIIIAIITLCFTFMYLARVTDAANVSMSEKTSSSNSEVSNNGEYEYRIKDDGTGEIIQYLGNEKVLNIPSIIDGVKITSIAGGILGYNKITEVTISEGITSINDNAFQWCDELKKVTIPISVTNIGRSAFGYCSELSEVNIPGGINVNIGVGVFTGYNQIEQITIYKGMKVVAESMFSECGKLRKVIIEEGVTSIEVSAFMYCGSLTEITIPESVTSINHHAFNGCDNLKDVYYTGSKTSWEKIYIREANESLKNAKIHILGVEPPTEPQTEPPTEPQTEPPTEPQTEPPTELQTEPPTEPQTEPPTESQTEQLTESSMEDSSEVETTEENKSFEEQVTDEQSTEPSVEDTSEDSVQEETDSDKTASSGVDAEELADFIDDSEEKTVKLQNIQAVKIDKNVFESMKHDNKNLVYSIVDKDNKLDYSWTFSSTEIKDTDFVVDLKIDRADKDDNIDKYIDDEKVLYINFSHHGELPGNVTINISVDDKFKDGANVYLYYYDETSDRVLKIGNNALTVKEGYVEFTISHCSTYFVTEEKLEVERDLTSLENADFNVIEGIKDGSGGFDIKILLIIIISCVVAVGVIIVVFRKANKKD